MFQPGDYVYPTDLPLRLLCRVAHAESLNPGGEGFQVLKLTPLEGPWKAGTEFIRFADGVRPYVRLAQGSPRTRIRLRAPGGTNRRARGSRYPD